MASISRRTWTYKGQPREAWVCRYNDGQKWRLKTFARQKDAAAWLRETQNQIADGTHVAERASKTLAEVGAAWLADGEAEGLERSTMTSYRGHLDLHVIPFLGNVKLAQLTAPMVAQFRRDLRAKGRSPAMIDKAVGTMGAVLAYAVENGLAGRNVVRTSRRRRGQEKRQRKRTEIPTKSEIRAMIEHATGRWRPLIVTAILTGLRSSELRGLTWADVDLNAKMLTVRQRADQWGQIGDPKSEAGRRDIPLAPIVVNVLREWKLACPRGELGLVFPNERGRPQDHSNILSRGFWPLQEALGITRTGKSKPRAKYSLHALRHAAASLFIEEGMNAKRVQTLMGHASVVQTFDRYGHLFADVEADQRTMARIQARLLA